MSEGRPEISRARANLTIALCFVVAILEGFDLQVIGLAAPQLMRALHLSPEQMGWAFSGSLIGLATGAIFGGWLADRIGRKPVLIGSVLALGLFTLLTTRATDFNSLFALRLAAGLALGGVMPNIIALVSEAVARAKITTSVAIMFTGMPIGGVLVAISARFLAVEHGWQSMFVLGGVLPFIVAPLLLFGLPETAKRTAAVVRASYWSTLFGKGQVLPTLLIWVVFLLTLLLLSLLLNWTPSLIISKGFAPTQAFVASMALNIGSVVGSFVIGVLCDRFGSRGPMLAVYIGMAISLYLLSLATSEGMLLGFAFLCGFTVMGAQFAMYGLAPRLYAPQARGAGVGAAVAVGRLGAIFGPLLAGQLIGAGATGSQVVLVLAPLALVGAVAVLALSIAAGPRLGAAGVSVPTGH